MTVHRKKLIEHSLPLDAINNASSREKSVRNGHPATLHLWWARRPLAACRAVLFSQLVDDPSSWPEIFSTDEEQAQERRRLHNIIEEMVEWPRADQADRLRFENAIEAARVEISRSIARNLGCPPPNYEDPQSVLDFLGTEGPPVYDPFCGGGAIPIEAQRLGLRSYGSDLNPVAGLICKSLVEFPPRFSDLEPISPDAATELRNFGGAEGLAEDVLQYGRWMQEKAKSRLGAHYPPVELDDGRRLPVIAWLWARTVPSPDPKLKGMHVPLASSFVVSSRSNNQAIVEPVIDPSHPKGWYFTMLTEGISKEQLAKAKTGTKSGRGSNFTCLLSGTAIDAEHIKREGKAGRMEARLMAIVAEGDRSRVYLPPNEIHENAAIVDSPFLPEIAIDLPNDPRNFWTVEYGLDSFEKLFTPRQLVFLEEMSQLISDVREAAYSDAQKSEVLRNRNDARRLSEGGTGPEAYADLIATYMSLFFGKLLNLGSSITSWMSDRGAFRETFARQAIPMAWDYAEANFFASTGASMETVLDKVSKAVAEGGKTFGEIQLIDAPQNHYPIRPAVISSDPPYYDNIGYSDLSDYFYVWHRKNLRNIHTDLFRRIIAPKSEELVATPYRYGGREAAEKHFIEGMKQALRAMNNASADAPLAIYYAFKQSEAAEAGVLSPGWAAFLQAVVDSGLQVDGTWPIRTESSGRIIARGANALASSVVLVCRARPDNSATVSRRDFQRELRVEMEQALSNQKETIPLPDRRQAAIGPGIGVFSKYTSVREPDDSLMSVATALALINREIDQILADGTEALDTETRFALEWYSYHGFKTIQGGAGQAISMLQGFNLSEAQINRSGLFLARAGNAKLLSRDEMPSDWRPSSDDNFTAWELAQHLARTLRAEDGGIDACGSLLAEKRDAGPDVLLIAERLFDFETNNGNAAEALVWNELQQSWAEIQSAADRAIEDGMTTGMTQGELEI